MSQGADETESMREEIAGAEERSKELSGLKGTISGALHCKDHPPSVSSPTQCVITLKLISA